MIKKLFFSNVKKIFILFEDNGPGFPKNSINKIKDKHCDLIFANDVSKKDIGFNSDYNKISVIDKDGNINYLPKNKKSFIANKIAKILLDKLLDDRNFN